MSALEKIVKLLPKLAPDEQFELLDTLTERLRKEWKNQAKTDNEPLATPTPKSTSSHKKSWKPRLRNLIEWGLVKPGEDKVYVLGRPDEPALLLDAYSVAYRGEKMPINDWARGVRNWPSINIYEYVVVERNNLTLGQIRQQYMKTHNIDQLRRR